MSFHYTIQSDKSPEEAIRSVEEQLAAIQFRVLWQTNLTDNLKNKGITSIEESYNILEVCNPYAAEKVLGQNPEANYFLPCKITVFEKNGKTQIGLPRPTSAMEPLKDAKLIEIVREIENDLIGVIDKAK